MPDLSVLDKMAAESQSFLKEKPAESTTTTVAEKTATSPEVKVEAMPETKAEVKVESASTAEGELQSILKKYNIASIDELEKKLAPAESKRKKSEDEIESEIVKYGIEKGKIKMDDFVEAKKVKDVSDKDLAFAEFAEKLKSKNKNITNDEINAKFDKKFGELVETKEEDADGNLITKVVYDDDEISERAKEIRNKKWQPIESIKKEYTDAESQKEIQEAAIQDFNKLKKEIPSAVQFKIGEDVFDYQIDEKLKSEVEKQVVGIYAYYKDTLRSKGIKDENFDVAQATQNVVKDVMFQNVLQIYSKQKVDAAVAEALKPYLNQMEKPLETGAAKDKVFDQQKELDSFSRQRRGY